jgi:ribosome-binding protein aMBF1 (putative translation factor)
MAGERQSEPALYPAQLAALPVSLTIGKSKSKERSAEMVLLRESVGQALRRARTEQSRTLRDVARDARVSLGYLSEVERGHKEASSELLNSICEALGLTLGSLMREVSLEITSAETATLVVVDAA